jgi:hypothetical protein
MGRSADSHLADIVAKVEKLRVTKIDLRAGVARQYLGNRTPRPEGVTSETGRFCCKSLEGWWGRFFKDRTGVHRKIMWGSTETTALATSDFPSRVATPLDRAVLRANRLPLVEAVISSIIKRRGGCAPWRPVSEQVLP